MTWTILLYGLVPLVAFVVIDAFAGLRWAVVTAVLFAVGDVFLMRHLSGAWDPGSIAAVVLFLGLGAVSIKVDNDLFFKLQPVALGVIFALYLAYVQMLGGGMMHRYKDMIRAMAPEEMRPALDQPEVLALFDQMVNGMVVVLLLHATLVAWTAVRCKNVTWLIMRGVGLWVLVLLMGFGLAIRRAVLGA